MTPIGTLHTPYKTKEECPIQPVYAAGRESRVEVFPPFAAGLKDIELFTHLYLIYQLDRAGEIEFVRPTFLDDTPRGIYASRHPCRPNGIGLSVVRLLRREGNTLIVDGADMLDQTPLLDIKPYLAKFDAFPEASDGWASAVAWRPKPLGRE